MPETSPVGFLLPVSVTFGPTQRVLEGRLIEVDDGVARVELTHPPCPELAEGTGVSVQPDGRRNLELVGVVRSIKGTRLHVEVSRTGYKDERWSPRERGRLQFRFMCAPVNFDVQTWAYGGPSLPGPWAEPDPRVELSLSGLGFLVDSEPPRGTILLEIIHPGTGNVFRISARVVRHSPTRRVGISWVGVQFESISESSGIALTEILTALQDAALEGFVDGCTLDLPDAPIDVAKPRE